MWDCAGWWVEKRLKTLRAGLAVVPGASLSVSVSISQIGKTAACLLILLGYYVDECEH